LVLSCKTDASQPADELIMSSQLEVSSWSWKTPASFSQFNLIRIGLIPLINEMMKMTKTFAMSIRSKPQKPRGTELMYHTNVREEEIHCRVLPNCLCFKTQVSICTTAATT